MPVPLAYFITFRPYGSWLPGDERGSVDLLHSVVGTPYAEPDAAREEAAAEAMTGEDVLLTPAMRSVIDRTAREVCAHRGWTALAVNARSTHVHAVVAAPCAPEKVMSDLKAWCTRRLTEAGLVAGGARVWSRHGSTRYLWTVEKVEEKIDYVVRLQDLPERFEKEREARERNERLKHLDRDRAQDSQSGG